MEAESGSRCEPPEQYIKEDGWHWLGEFNDAGRWPFTCMLWRGGRWDIGNAAELHKWGYRYICPVLTPPDMERLMRDTRVLSAAVLHALLSDEYEDTGLKEKIKELALHYAGKGKEDG